MSTANHSSAQHDLYTTTTSPSISSSIWLCALLKRLLYILMMWIYKKHWKSSKIQQLKLSDRSKTHVLWEKEDVPMALLHRRDSRACVVFFRMWTNSVPIFVISSLLSFNSAIIQKHWPGKQHSNRRGVWGNTIRGNQIHFAHYNSCTRVVLLYNLCNVWVS